MIIALTGGLCVGKETIANYLKSRFNFYIIKTNNDTSDKKIEDSINVDLSKAIMKVDIKNQSSTVKEKESENNSDKKTNCSLSPFDVDFPSDFSPEEKQTEINMYLL